MAKYALSSTIFIFFAGFWLLAALVPVYGKGSRDGDLSRAEQYIANKEYDQAISLLTDYTRRNPGKFDDAQQLLNKIYRIRENFNLTAELLIETLLNDSDNDERILMLTTRLRSLEHENSPVLVDFLSKTHEIALFNVSRERLRMFLVRGRELIDRGDYQGAFQIYTDAMAIMQEEFFAGNYGAAAQNQVRQETARVHAIIASFRREGAQLEAVSAELTRAVSQGQHARVPEIMMRLVSAMDMFIAHKQNVYASVSVFENLLLDIQRANPEMGDRNHIAFIIRAIYGRSEESIQEGILGVFDAFWRNSAGSSLDAITQYIETTNNNGLAYFNRRDFTSAVNTLAGITAYSNVTPIFFEKYRQLIPSTSANTVTINDVTVLLQDIPVYLKLMSLNEASTSLGQAAAVPAREQTDVSALASLRSGRLTTSQAFDIEQQTRNILIDRKKELEAIKTRAVQVDTQISAHRNFPYIKNVITAIDSLYAATHVEEQQSALRYYTIAQADVENNLPAIRGQFEQGRNFAEARLITEAQRVLTPMLSTADEIISRSSPHLTELRDEPPEIASNMEIRNLLNRYQTSVNELTSIYNQGTAIAETLQGRLSQSEALRLEGERLFLEAQAAFQRRDYDSARDRIQRSSDRIDASLALQESAELRNYRDTLLVNLGRQIAVAENEVIIAEVRRLIDTASNQYFSGNFYQAEENLNRARSRWRLVSADENEEIVYWLNMVHRGTSVSSARVLPPTAPLYPEISQMLSLARRNYEDGMRLINAGQRSQGIEKFDEARVQTREVKLMFPVNQEAGLLELRMDQFTDPRAFNAEFEQRLGRAIAGTRQGSIENYSDLLNLAEINPNYPGIRNIVFEAEVAMGIRPPPPNPADVARSRELTASARRILESNLTAQFEIAITQINQAITLDPSNTEAPPIKDRILNRSNTTEPRAIVLSSEDEAQYQRAVREFQAGNNLIAYALVERLLQNPGNRNVTKIVELQRRIQSVL